MPKQSRKELEQKALETAQELLADLKENSRLQAIEALEDSLAIGLEGISHRCAQLLGRCCRRLGDNERPEHLSLLPNTTTPGLYERGNVEDNEERLGKRGGQAGYLPVDPPASVPAVLQDTNGGSIVPAPLEYARLEGYRWLRALSCGRGTLFRIEQFGARGESVVCPSFCTLTEPDNRAYLEAADSRQRLPVSWLQKGLEKLAAKDRHAPKLAFEQLVEAVERNPSILLIVPAGTVTIADPPTAKFLCRKACRRHVSYIDGVEMGARFRLSFVPPANTGSGDLDVVDTENLQKRTGAQIYTLHGERSRLCVRREGGPELDPSRLAGIELELVCRYLTIGWANSLSAAPETWVRLAVSTARTDDLESVLGRGPGAGTFAPLPKKKRNAAGASRCDEDEAEPEEPFVCGFCSGAPVVGFECPAGLETNDALTNGLGVPLCLVCSSFVRGSPAHANVSLLSQHISRPADQVVGSADEALDVCLESSFAKTFKASAYCDEMPSSPSQEELHEKRRQEERHRYDNAPPMRVVVDHALSAWKADTLPEDAAIFAVSGLLQVGSLPDGWEVQEHLIRKNLEERLSLAAGCPLEAVQVSGILVEQLAGGILVGFFILSTVTMAVDHQDTVKTIDPREPLEYYKQLVRHFADLEFQSKWLADEKELRRDYHILGQDAAPFKVSPCALIFSVPSFCNSAVNQLHSAQMRESLTRTVTQHLQSLQFKDVLSKSLTMTSERKSEIMEFMQDAMSRTSSRAEGHVGKERSSRNSSRAEGHENSRERSSRNSSRAEGHENSRDSTSAQSARADDMVAGEAGGGGGSAAGNAAAAELEDPCHSGAGSRRSSLAPAEQSRRSSPNRQISGPPIDHAKTEPVNPLSAALEDAFRRTQSGANPKIHPGLAVLMNLEVPDAGDINSGFPSYMESLAPLSTVEGSHTKQSVQEERLSEILRSVMGRHGVPAEDVEVANAMELALLSFAPTPEQLTLRLRENASAKEAERCETLLTRWGGSRWDRGATTSLAAVTRDPLYFRGQSAMDLAFSAGDKATIDILLNHMVESFDIDRGTAGVAEGQKRRSSLKDDGDGVEDDGEEPGTAAMGAVASEYYCAIDGDEDALQRNLADTLAEAAILLNCPSPVSNHLALYVCALYPNSNTGTIVERLVRRRADPNLADPQDGDTPLIPIIRRGEASLVELMLKLKADVNTRAADSQTALQISITRGSREIAEALLKHPGCEVDAGDSRGRTVLVTALTAGLYDMVRLVLDARCNVDARDRGGAAPILHATAVSQPDICDLLLERRADANAIDPADGSHVIHVAFATRNVHFIKALLSAGADCQVPHPRDQRAPLHFAAAYRMTQVASSLLLMKAEVDVRSNIGDTPLRLATQVGDLEMVQMLCEAAADPNCANRAGCAAIHAAVNTGNSELVELLVSFKGDVQLADQRRWRPLHYAAACNDGAITKCLLDNGADPQARSYHGCTPYQLGLEAKQLQLERLEKQKAGQSKRPSQLQQALTARGPAIRPRRTPRPYTMYRRLDNSKTSIVSYNAESSGHLSILREEKSQHMSSVMTASSGDDTRWANLSSATEDSTVGVEKLPPIAATSPKQRQRSGPGPPILTPDCVPLVSLARGPDMMQFRARQRDRLNCPSLDSFSRGAS
eukprot:TRINITY_DN3316_c0_g1_i1.p1 TRINITY_DN3316_c0_g1~~TRINITY_DN3316_c0_g1_i1.p1  ORF type:complete len:1645 (-),score=353.56 TRINITY_DN3316_c0_g1_i1:5-4939(-)